MRSLRTVAVGLALVAVVGLAACSSEAVGGAADGASTQKVAAKTAAGSATPGTAAPVAVKPVPLTDATVIGGIAPQSGPLKINGTEYGDSVFSNVTCSGGANWDYDLDRAYKTLVGTAGVGDNSAEGDKVTMAFVGDGRDLGRATVELGKPTPINVNVDGVLRLNIAVTHAGGAACLASVPMGTYAAIGDAGLTK